MRASDIPPELLARATVKGISLPTLDAPKGEPRRGRLNRTEARFAAEYLEPLRLAGTIGGYAFEPIRLLIADAGPNVVRAYYCPDFIAWTRSRVVAFEIKGFWRESARLRIKVAAERHPYMVFCAVKRVGGRWEFEVFGRGKTGDGFDVWQEF